MTTDDRREFNDENIFEMFVANGGSRVLDPANHLGHNLRTRSSRRGNYETWPLFWQPFSLDGCL
jgi:hypothetical protein